MYYSTFYHIDLVHFIEKLLVQLILEKFKLYKNWFDDFLYLWDTGLVFKVF